MASILFYDTTAKDREQLTTLLEPTDHHWEFVDEPLSADNVRPEAEAISVFVSSKVTRELMEKMPKLKLIATRSMGYDHVDMRAAKEKGITVTNVPSYGDHTVAEYTFMLLLALSRRLLPALEAVDKGKVRNELLTGIDLTGKTLGIIGAGRIGRMVARIARGFDMHVLAYDLNPTKEGLDLGIQYIPLDDLLAQSDIVSIHCPYTEANKHLINKEAVDKMKSGSLIINTARGELVDTKALIEGLQSGRLNGAAVDVVEGEKLVDIDEEMMLLRGNDKLGDKKLEQSLELSILRKMPNVIVTPHNAFNTSEAIERINEATATSVTKYWSDDVPFRVADFAPQPGKLVLIRHGESEWNALGKWTGTRDVHLTEKGFHEATLLGISMKDITVDYAYTSQQIRAFETLEGILNASQQFEVPYERSAALNERDYGDYTGKNKWDMQQILGDEDFNHLRRDWDYPVPHGESLKMVYERVQPFYMKHVVPRLLNGQNVLIVSHGNAIRALMKYIDQISDTDIASVEMLFGQIVIYSIDSQGLATSKHELLIDSPAPPA